MTGITLRRCSDVGCRLYLSTDCGIAAEVTGRTLANQAGVIHIGWLECSETGMAVIALAAGRNMGTGLGQALVRCSVVAVVGTRMVAN